MSNGTRSLPSAFVLASIVVCLVLFFAAGNAIAEKAGFREFGGFGVLGARTSFGGEFDDSTLLSNGIVAVDVPSLSDSDAWGICVFKHFIPNGTGSGVGLEADFLRGSMKAPGLLAPQGGYDASYWNLCMDITPGYWLSIVPSNDFFQISLAGRLGVAISRVKIKDSAASIDGTFDAAYYKPFLRYGGGLRVRLGSVFIAMEWVRSRGSARTVSVDGDTIDLEDKINGETTDILISFSIGV